MTTWPQPWTPASVRPAPGQFDRGAHDARHRGGELAHDGARLAVDGEAVEIGAVVGDGQPHIAHDAGPIADEGSASDEFGRSADLTHHDET